jgi:hypothetical protein
MRSRFLHWRMSIPENRYPLFRDMRYSASGRRDHLLKISGIFPARAERRRERGNFTAQINPI